MNKKDIPFTYCWKCWEVIDLMRQIEETQA